jgi:hypothetical protein
MRSVPSGAGNRLLICAAAVTKVPQMRAINRVDIFIVLQKADIYYGQSLTQGFVSD